MLVLMSFLGGSIPSMSPRLRKLRFYLGHDLLGRARFGCCRLSRVCLAKQLSPILISPSIVLSLQISWVAIAVSPSRSANMRLFHLEHVLCFELRGELPSPAFLPSCWRGSSPSSSSS